MRVSAKNSKEGIKTKTRKSKTPSKSLKVLFVVSSKSGFKSHFSKNFQAKDALCHYGLNSISFKEEFKVLNDTLLRHLKDLFEMEESLIGFDYFYKYDELWEELTFTNDEVREFIKLNSTIINLGAVFVIDLKKARYDFVKVFRLDENNSQLFENFGDFIFYDSNQDFIKEKIQIFLSSPNTITPKETENEEV